MSNLPATLMCDFYKLSHREQYPEGTETIYSTWTPRSNKYFPRTDKVIAFGFQSFIKKYLIDYFNDNFFNKSPEDVIGEYSRVLKYCLNVEKPDCSHIAKLHKLGYLPISIKALPEGTKVPIRVPMLTIRNTNKDFFWLTNYLETLMSCSMWVGCTSATIAYEYRKLLDSYAKETGGDINFVPFQGHDFSMRGMSSLESAEISGAAHLLSFTGTDTIPAILYLEKYYNADIEKELVGTSIPATEHSVMCAGGDKNEFKTYERLITEIYPTGFVSIVSDTWDLWQCIDKIIKPLKDKIMARDGKVVIRPDSGDPVDIICGDIAIIDSEMFKNIPIKKGVIELLWDIFGGIINEKGYKVLDPHIGCIYGDAITLDRCKEICKRLKAKGFASTNMVYGVGSYTYQYNTRDTFGFALKSTMCEINGKEKKIFKDPITDDGTKKSQTGVVAVNKNDKDELEYIDNLGFGYDLQDLLEDIFCDGKLIKETSLAEIRSRILI